MQYMTREEIEKRLEKEGKDFNDRDLSNADLSKLSIGDRNFKRSNLHLANLSHATFTSVTFKQTSLTGANLRHASFEYCDFNNCDLSDVDLSFASFNCTDFHECCLSRAIVKSAMFDTCYFNATTWEGARVKRTTFDCCTGVLLPPHKVYESLSDMDDEDEISAICRERLAPLASLLSGTFSQDADFSFVHGLFRERKYRVDVAHHAGCPSLFLAQDSSQGDFFLYRDVKKVAKLGATDGARIKRGDEWFHLLSDEVFLDGTPEGLDEELRVFERLPVTLRERAVGIMGQHKLDVFCANAEGLSVEYKKDILHLDLTTSVPDILELLSLMADAFSGRPVPENLPVSTPPEPKAPEPKAPEPKASEPKASEPGFSFDLDRRCRHCNASISWGQLECTACGHDPMKTL